MSCEGDFGFDGLEAAPVVEEVCEASQFEQDSAARHSIHAADIQFAGPSSGSLPPAGAASKLRLGAHDPVPRGSVLLVDGQGCVVAFVRYDKAEARDNCFRN